MRVTIPYRLLLAGLALFPCAGCELAHNYTDPQGPRYSGAYALDPAAMSQLPSLSIVTFNIRFGDEYELAAEELASDPRLSKADVLLLQEMDAPRSDAIARRLSMSYVYYPGSIHDNGRDFGNAVLSRWPILADGKIVLPHRNPTDGRIRIAVHATIATPLGAISAYSVHTETPWLGPRARLDQAAAVRDHAVQAGLDALIGGDFNTGDPGSLDETVRLFRAREFEWASERAGNTSGGYSLDHIFVKRLAPQESGTTLTRASDHRPAWARVDFATSP